MSNEKTDAIIGIDDLKSLWRIFLKNWYIIVSCLFLSYIAAYFYTYKLIDVYAASTQILLKSNDAYDSQSIIQSGVTPYGYKDYSENYNAMRVIKSYDLIKKTVDKLDLSVSYFIKGHIRTKELYDHIPFKVEFTSLNPFIYEQMIDFKIVNISQYAIKYKIGDAEKSVEGLFNRPLITTDFNINVKKSPLLQAATEGQLKDVDYLIQFHNKSSLVRKFQQSISLEIPEYSGIVQITIEDIIPARAITFLDTLGKVYIDNTLNTKLDINSRTLTYIEKQLSELTNLMAVSEDKLQNYKESEAILDLSKEEAAFFDQLVISQTELNRIELMQDAFLALEKYIIEGSNSELAPSTVFLPSSDPALIANLNSLYDLQKKYNQNKVLYTLSSPDIQVLEKTLQERKLNILSYINNSKTAIEAQRAGLKDQVAQLESKISNIPIKQRELLNIERNLEVNQKMYSFLLEKKAENTIARAGIVPNSKIIESALSVGIVKPNKTKITFSFIGVGLLISLIIVLIRTSFYETIESLEELKQRTSMTILGEVIYSEEFLNVDRALNNDPRAAITESFRTLRTNLQFMDNNDSKCQIYLLTSNHPSEGKTFCAVNIGALLAQSGRKVLILELDLHKPRVYKALGLKSQKNGITSILSGKGSIQEHVISTDIPNLDAMLSGATAPNASELILKKGLQEILDFGKANYDNIIIDTPPVSLISDALVLMQYADVNIFVMSTKFPYRDSLNRAQDVFQMLQPKNFCLVLNSVKRTRSNYYYRRYGAAYKAYSNSEA